MTAILVVFLFTARIGAAEPEPQLSAPPPNPHQAVERSLLASRIDVTVASLAPLVWEDRYPRAWAQDTEYLIWLVKVVGPPQPIPPQWPGSESSLWTWSDEAWRGRVFDLYLALSRSVSGNNAPSPPYFNLIEDQMVDYFAWLGALMLRQDPSLTDRLTGPDAKEQRATLGFYLGELEKGSYGEIPRFR